MKVAVLGCGPAGLMAAHAAKLAGAEEVAILSKRRKSELYGAQYLHTPIPGMTDNAPVTVRYQLVGTTEDYRRKVYGEDWDGTTSPEDHEGDHDAWDIRTTYNNLWSEYGGLVAATDMSASWFLNWLRNAGQEFDYILSSVPKPSLCGMPKAHQFAGQKIWALGDAPERGVFADDWFDELPNNTVVCSGLEKDYWYRISRVFGYATVEWPSSAVLPAADGASEVNKPLSNTCTCWDSTTEWGMPPVRFIGRFGSWTKGVLSDSAFHETMDLLVGEPVT